MYQCFLYLVQIFVIYSCIQFFFKDFLQALQILKQCFKPRYSTTDHCIQESLKQICNSGLFLGNQGYRENKKIQTAISMQLLRAVFLSFHGQKKSQFFEKLLDNFLPDFFLIFLQKIGYLWIFKFKYKY